MTRLKRRLDNPIWCSEYFRANDVSQDAVNEMNGRDTIARQDQRAWKTRLTPSHRPNMHDARKRIRETQIIEVKMKNCRWKAWPEV